ncbi:MAG: hypothetical protein RLZZ338_4079 [Cyanobacteriota bacterium]
MVKEWKFNNLTIGLVVSPIIAPKQARCLHYFINPKEFWERGKIHHLALEHTRKFLLN